MSAVDTNFYGSNLTGTCIENWRISRDTIFDNVICDYVYLKADKQERRPHIGIFNPGEFAALLQQAFYTLDLIFKDGIDWQAFFQTFQEIRSQYTNQSLAIQAIEKKQGGIFIVRLEVAEGVDKATIESRAKELYETKLILMEQQYRTELQAKDGEIAAYKQHSASMEEIAKSLADRSISVDKPDMSPNPEQLKILECIERGIKSDVRIAEALSFSIDLVRYYIESMQNDNYLFAGRFMVPNGYGYKGLTLQPKGKTAIEDPSKILPVNSMSDAPKYDMRGSQFAGGFAETVQGNQIGGTINNASSETPSLAEAAAEIQNLLKQLEASNPNPTEAQQTAYLDAMIPPTRRERFVGALRAAGGAAVEEVPYGAGLKALVEGWQKSNG